MDEDLTLADREDLEKFLDHFPANGERDLQILKGHLLFEEWLRDILRLQLTYPEALFGSKGARLECHQLICLVESITPQSQGMPWVWVWVAAKKLNTLRNDLAHNLTSESLEDRVADFVSYVRTKGGEPEDFGSEVEICQENKFVGAMVAMCAAMASLKSVLRTTR